MQTRFLGGTGLKASVISFGTWYLPSISENGKKKVDKDQAIKIIRKAYELGINFFDTADVYRGVYNREQLSPDFSTIGQSEKILGEALDGYDRESFIISTKVMGRLGPLLNDQGLNRKHVLSAIRGSLERLRMKYVDFYLYHAPDNITSPEFAIKTMNLLIDNGQILHYGLSNFTYVELKKYLETAKETGMEAPAIIQDKLNLIERRNLTTVIKIAEENRMASMIYSPLAQGILAGRYINKDEKGSRKEYEKNFRGIPLMQENYDKLMRFFELSNETGIPMSTLSLMWVISRGEYIVPIIGASKLEQLEENVKAGELEINSQLMDKLDNIFK